MKARRYRYSEPGFDTIASRPPCYEPLTVLTAVETANPQVVGRSTGDDECVRLAHSRFPVGLRLQQSIDNSLGTKVEIGPIIKYNELYYIYIYRCKVLRCYRFERNGVGPETPRGRYKPLTRLKLTKSKRIWLMSLDIFLTRNEHSPTSFNKPGKFGLTKYVTLLATSALHDDVTAANQA